MVPDLSTVEFFGTSGHTLLLFGLIFCGLGMLFGLVSYAQLKRLPVHQAMREVSELIYVTCKAYLVQQGKFLLLLLAFIGAVIVAYFMLTGLPASKIAIVLLFSLIGMAGSYGVAWYGIRINTFANSRTAFSSLAGKGFPVYAIPLRAGMSVGMMLISVELLFMLGILLFVPGDVAGACFLGFAIGESLGAAVLLRPEQRDEGRKEGAREQHEQRNETSTDGVHSGHLGYLLGCRTSRRRGRHGRDRPPRAPE
jgi:K(+)-stimulated pyrophosphate-energized sodium pump